MEINYPMVDYMKHITFYNVEKYHIKKINKNRWE